MAAPPVLLRLLLLLLVLLAVLLVVRLAVHHVVRLRVDVLHLPRRLRLLPHRLRLDRGEHAGDHLERLLRGIDLGHSGRGGGGSRADAGRTGAHVDHVRAAGGGHRPLTGTPSAARGRVGTGSVRPRAETLVSARGPCGGGWHPTTGRPPEDA